MQIDFIEQYAKHDSPNLANRQCPSMITVPMVAFEKPDFPIDNTESGIRMDFKEQL
jgi:hypothetical protein